MTPAYSSIDSDKVDLGDLADYSITSAAIPVSVSDSSGAITTFTTKHAVDHNDAFYAINQKLTLETDHAGSVDGKVTSVGTPANGVMSLTADTMMARMAVDKRVYPIYRSRQVGRHYVGAAIDHWTQTTGLFYDHVPGRVITYHSCYGHDYVFSQNPQYRPRVMSPREQLVYQVDAGRVLYSLVRGTSTLILTSSVETPGQRIPNTDNLPVPKADSGEQLVLSPAFKVSGNHSGTMTWYMSSAPADQLNVRAAHLELGWSNAAGFSMTLRHPGALIGQPLTSIQVLPPSGPLTAGNYRVLIGLKEKAGSSTQTVFTMRVINETTGAVSTRTADVTTPLRGTQVQLNYVDVSTNTSGEPANSTPWGLYGYFVSTIPDSDLPAAALPVRKSFAPTDYEVTIIPGFSGDVWTHVKQLLALHRMDMWYEDGQLRVAARQRQAQEIGSLGRLTPSLAQRGEAKFVEVVSQNMTSHNQVPRVFFSSDSVYQVATGEVQTVSVQTEHSIDTINNPTCVSGITPYPYKDGGGQYVITGSDGYIVAPAWWEANGGRITARTTEREGEIEITIKGPDADSPRSPYRVSEGDAGRPALYITGMGVLSDPETLKIATGNPAAVTDVGETVDIPFITSRALAYHAAVQVSLPYAAPELKLSGTEAHEPDEAGVLDRRGAGTLFEHDGAVYRVGNLTQTARSNNFSESVQYTTLRHRQERFTGRTIRQANTDNAGRSIKDRALKPLRSA